MNNKRLNLVSILAFICVLFLTVGVYLTSDIVYADDIAQNESASASVSMQMYNPSLDSGYVLSNKVEKTVFDSTAYTSLSVVVDDGDISTAMYNGYNAFGVTGTSVSLNFKINYFAGIDQPINGEWLLCGDTYGSKEGEKINGVTTGRVDSGAVIVQTSDNGVDWSNDNKAKYIDGLYTTDYYTHYKTDEQVIYTPSGSDLSEGVYIRVLYAYEVYDQKNCQHPTYFLWWQTGYEHDNDNIFINYVEEYSFYLCYNSPQSVVFHNLSLGDKIEESLKEEDSSLIEISKCTETLKDGSVTVTGFVIDKTLNQATTINVKKDNQEYLISPNQEIREEGRYDITVKTALGEESTTTIYVLSKTKEELYSLYFGDSFLTGKRIFTKDSMPTYEGGLTFYNLQSIMQNNPCLWGLITNQNSKNTASIGQNNLQQKHLIVDAGEYEVKLNTNITYNTEEPSGDNHCFSFKFKIIEKGTAPGPQINKENLLNFSKLANPSNLNSTYYGVTFQSAHKGNITLAFSTKKEAVNYAYNYEKGMVEVQNDGSFRYNGSLVIAQKVKYDSAWDLTDAINYFAEQAVQKLRFDLSDDFTFLTLSDDVLSTVENVRTLELTKSVVLFANEEEKLNLLKSGDLPIINSQKYSYLEPGATGSVVSGYSDFHFIKDKNGYDSNSVSITDIEGNCFSIQYNNDVEEQLKNLGCKTGVITIKEETVYGDVATYEAVYIADGINSSVINLSCYENKEKTTKLIDINNNNCSLILNAFSFSSVVDELDPYGTIIIEKDGNKEFFNLKEVSSKMYTERGSYVITLVNRLGFSYSFAIDINEELYYTTQLTGDGIDGSQYITYTDEDVISLPQLTKYGYNFVGYKTSNGATYSNEVQAILLKGSAVLETVWAAKEFILTLETDLGIYEKKTIVFGASYTLPTIESTNSQRFVGWKNSNGDFITTFTVEEEGDIMLLAYFEPIGKSIFDTDERGLNWLVIAFMCLGSLIIMGIAHYVISNVILSNYASWMWIACSILLVVLLVFVPLPWWALSLIEVGGIILMMGFINVVEKF